MSIWRGVSSDKVQGECKLKFSGGKKKWIRQILQ